MIYLDYQATTPMAPEVVEAMMPWRAEKFANPHAPYTAGREAGEYSWGLTAQCDEDGIAKAKEVGMDVVLLTPEERAPFFETARGVWPEFEERVGGRDLIDRLVAASE